jgi:branched-chain amino acid transport system substrate-binding protein
MNKKLIWSIIVVVVILLVLGFTKNSQKASGETIKIGAVLPLTGVGASYGEPQKNAIYMAVSEINAAGGINGRTLQVIYEDDQTNPKGSVSAVQKLNSVDQVVAIIGPAWDSLANAALPVVSTAKIPTVLVSVAPDSLDGSNDYVFSTYPTNASYQPIFEEYLRAYPGKTIVSIVYSGPWGITHQKALEKAAANTNNKIIKEIVVPQFDNNDIQRELSLVKALKPDIIFTALSTGDSKEVLVRNKSLGIDAMILGQQNEKFAFANKDLTADFYNKVTIFSRKSANKDYLEKYQNKYGQPSVSEADGAYDAVYVLKKAIEIGGGTREGIEAGLKKIRNFQGVTGIIDYSTSNYSNNKSPILEKLEGGNFVEIKK